MNISTTRTFEGQIITDWQTYVMTIGATTTPPTKGTMVFDVAQWRRVGSNMEITYTYRHSAAGTGGSGTYLFSLPAGYTIDMTNFDAAVTSVVGNCNCYNGSNYYPGVVLAYNSGNVSLQYASPASSVGSSAMSLNSAATIVISFKASVPIVGWS